MAKEPSKTLPTTTTRRTGVRRVIGRERAEWRAHLGSPEVLWGVCITFLFVLLAGVISYVAMGQVRLAPGRIATETRVMRSQVVIEDERATQRARESARLRTPRVYALDKGVLTEVLASIENLPAALAGVESIEGVEPTLREQFALTPEALAALKTQVENGEVTPAWRARVARLAEALALRPLLASDAYQRELATPPDVLLLIRDPGEEAGLSERTELVGQARAISLGGNELATAAAELASGFAPAIRPAIAARLEGLSRPTYAFDPGRTAEDQESAARLVEPVMTLFPRGTTIFTRGEALDADDIALAAEEQRLHLSELGPLWGTVARFGRIGVIGAIALALAGYVWLFCARIRRNPARMAALGGLMLSALAAAVWGVAAQPSLIAVGAVAPTLFVTVIVSIAYTPRTALAFGVAQGVLTAVALDLPVVWVAVAAVGVGFAVWQLGDVRERDSLIRMGVVTALGLAGATVLAAPAQLPLPLTFEGVRQVLWDAGMAAFGALSVAGVALFILPSVERLFDITTGMTLIELRDPKEPLLRRLQQKAPGTYNHSLNVASLAESAADAIGADSLLTYVGALYHDIGKMNKPDYFVENQPAGFNRHDKLSPAMSLLLIIGHVKDGMEMAREAALPRRLHHFIEAHHGTTLVEFFYRRAKEQAAQEGAEAPTETDYRYPGPKPRTKEVAILMICDAVESAARTLSDPTPSRIDQLVREIATRRLMDGQFDECDLTLREIGIIVEKVSAALAAIYHGRIAYPAGKEEKKPVKDPQRNDDAVGGGVKPERVPAAG